MSKLRSKMAKSPGKKAGTTLSEKRINNVMTTLNAGLKLAVRWKVLSSMPCAIEVRAVHYRVPS